MKKTTQWGKTGVLLLLFLIPTILLSQETITGKVVIEGSGEPAAFMNIVEEGTNNGTSSDIDGSFSITVNSLPVRLKVFALGFAEKVIPVSLAGDITIQVSESSEALDEVVVTGLATSVKRENLANAVSTVSAEELAELTPPQTLDGALAGKFVGAQITRSSGAPGGGISVRLRGVTSVNGNSQPLYIVDGVYVNNNSISGAGLNAVSGAAAGGNASNQDNPSNRIADINPDDIESVEILKGASAAAIYGARAAAGVIIIKTKTGKQGRTKISFNQDVGFNTILNSRGQRTYTEDRVFDFFFNPNPGDPIAEQRSRDAANDQVALFRAARDSGRLIDYEDEIFGEEGFISNTNVSISGGSENTQYYAAFSNNAEDGIVKNTGYTRKSIRFNLNHTFFKDKIRLSLNTNYVDSKADRGFFNNDNSGTTIGVSLTSTLPYRDLFPNELGVYPDNPDAASNPLQTRDLITNREDVDRFIIGGNLDIKLFENDKSNLKLILSGGVDYYQLTTNALFPKILQFQKVTNGGLNGLVAVGDTENKDANYSGFLVHNYKTDSDINFTTQAGATKLTFERNTVNTVASDLIAFEDNLDQAANVGVNQFRQEQEDVGFFVQEEVNYQGKIIGTLGIRGDKSSNNGDANEFFYYPKASLAVNLQNFGLWESENLNQLKIRGAYGEAGNFAPNGALFTTYTNSLIDGVAGIVVPPTLGDPNIEPERQKELELGLDASFLKRRVNLEFTYYIKSVDDLILQANVEPSSGFTTEFANAGDLENKGVEVTLNANVFQGEDFEWNTGVLFFKNKSEVTQLDVAPFNLGSFGTGLGTFRIEEGKSVTQIVGNNADGDLVVLGDAEPDFQMTFTNNFRYKDFTLSFLWHWKEGGDNINLTNLLTDFGGTSPDFDDIDLDPAGVTPNGPFRVGAFSSGNATPFTEDASYLRLREIGLYYTLPTKFLDSAFKGNVSRVKIGFSGNNLINIFDYNSYDPEVSNFGSGGLSTGVEVTPFPSSKRVLFHLAVDF
ncbi:SusC/RagA family TonB-linked outer membrane protein [Aquimarina algicola]|uniref:SusC/RagA family TonB-linked outer membrane protein n=1 Tax=Aquimarina algicola TaxID=2589995 RepID=A0A504JH68_9FLAO|nr:SusC/RagA family TonB-linked outer membrane protein [Aquimarina algicola]TPN86179.1 SusC/RagA family TonB-linked outer membrane protein [Aquimarina algicola]